MRHHALVTGAALIFLAGPLVAQSSEFGIRGLGLPGRGLTAKAIGTGGGIGLFEGESSRNPAALGLLTRTTTSFTGTSSWRTSVNETGSGNTYDTRFPLISVAGPIVGSRLSIGFSSSLFANRDFTVATAGVEVVRDVPLQFTDTLASRGGISDMRLSVAWLTSKKIMLGGGIDFLTGQDRMSTRRVWEDSLYAPTRTGTDLSFHTLGFTAGVIYELNPRWQMAATAQVLGTLRVQQDSAPPVGAIKMPMSLSAGVRGTIVPRLRVSGMIVAQNWSRANNGLIANGGLGARNTLEFAGGVEVLSHVHAADRLPLRLGVRRTDLPFALRTGADAREMAFSLGSGIRFAGSAGGIDFAVERVHRSQSSTYHENAWQLTLGISVRASAGGR